MPPVSGRGPMTRTKQPTRSNHPHGVEMIRKLGRPVSIRRWLDLPLAVPAVRGLLYGVAVLLIVVLTGVVGYVVIADFHPFDALYQTILTVTTIGFGEIEPLDRGGRVFTIFLAIFGVGAVLWLLGAVTSIIVEGDLQRDLERWRMTRALERLHGHYIICGAGRVGTEVAQELTARGESYVVIDRNLSPEDESGNSTAFAIRGDASDNEILERAGVRMARGLVVATGDDADNTFIVLSAKGINPSIYVVARANELETAAKLQQAGADRVISPQVIAGRRMAVSVLHPAVVDFAETVLHGMETGEVVAKLDVQSGSEWDGLTIADAFRERGDVHMLGVRPAGGDVNIAPSMTQILDGGDAILVYGRITAIEDVSQCCREVATTTGG